MNTKMAKFPAINPNPVLSVAKDGTVIYSNNAGEPLLHGWGVRVEDKLPLSIIDLVQRLISCNISEKIEVKVGERIYLLAFHPIQDEECVNIYGFDISEQKELEEKLRESEKREQARSDELAAVLDAVPVAVFISHEPQAVKIVGNRIACEWIHVPMGTNFSKSAPKGERPETFNLFKNGIEMLPEEMPSQMAAAGIDVNDCEIDIVSDNGDIRHLLGNARPLRDEQGNLRGSISAFIDITERKKAEEALKKAYDSLEEKVKEHTNELEEAQRMAHIGNWEWNIATDKAYWSNEMYRIFKRDPKQSAPSLKEYLSYIHPDDLDYYCNATINTRKVGTSEVDFRIILSNGEERTLHLKSKYIFNDENIPVRIKGIVQDITERKKAEEALVKIDIARKQEIHHRIKNNLQVISSLLDIQAEKFKGIKNIRESQVLEAFKESQDRVISMALIHEELHKGRAIDTLNFSHYIEELADNLLLSYRVGNEGISLVMDIEEDAYFDMDTAVPLGIIVNELVSNALKHAFSGRDKGEIRIKLIREEALDYKEGGYKNTIFTLSVSDNGIGIPEYLDIENLDSLGLQLVTILVEQLDGELELKRDNGTEFTIRFTVKENNDHASAPAPQLFDND